MKQSLKKWFSEEKLPWNRSLLWIFTSTLFITGSTTFALLYYQHVRELRAQDNAYRVVAIIQSSPEKDTLQTVYLAELLKLSIDRPANLYCLDAKEAVQTLLTSPVLRDVAVQKIKPGMLFIDYTMRKPFAYLGDYKNAMVDKDGVIFPFKPFYTPKKIPEIFLGLNMLTADSIGTQEFWGATINDKRFSLALEFYDHLKATGFEDTFIIRRIDVSKAYEPSYGQRQIVLVIEDQLEKDLNGHASFYSFSRTLRLDPDKYKTGMERWRHLLKYLREKEMSSSICDQELVQNNQPNVIDLRIPDLAFIKTISVAQ